MAEISRFHGIVIGMMFDEHPPPHFHARYGEFEISVTLDESMTVQGGSHVER